MAEQTFKVGDKVRHAWFDTVEVAYGPYTDMRGHTRYMVRVASGGEQPTSPEMMTALPAFAVGDKAKMDGEREPVEILAGPYKNRYITWYTVKAEVGETTAAEDNLTALPADTFEYAGVTYDLTSAYRDRDGDRWRFSANPLGGDGTPRSQFRDRTEFEDDNYTLSKVVQKFGPLTKI